MSARVLLVEDNPDDEALAVRALQRCGVPLTVDIARDGAQALEKLGLDGATEVDSLPQLVFLDIKLPKVSGLEVLRHIRGSDQTADLTVVMLTSSDEPSDIDAAAMLNSNKYVRKPIDYGEFMSTLKSVIFELLPAA
jgi:CheY-like chemotaxis protein